MDLAASRMSDPTRAVRPGDTVLLIHPAYPAQHALLMALVSPDRPADGRCGVVQVALVADTGRAWVAPVEAIRVGLRVDEV